MEEGLETSPSRAWRDTEDFRKSAASFWALEIVGAALFAVGGGFIGFWLTPTPSTPFQQFAYPTLGSATGLILGFFIVSILIYLWNLLRAPYRQRNELRHELSNIKTGKPTSATEAITQGFERMGELIAEKFNEVLQNANLATQNPKQPNTLITNMDEVIGMRETATGKPVFLHPSSIDTVELGAIATGSKQTFSGLLIDDSPIYIRIPKLAYVVIMITPINNDIVEVKFMVQIKTQKHQAAILTVDIDSQEVALLIKECATGFFTQVNRTSIAGLRGATTGNIGIQIETEHAVRSDD